MKKDPKDEESSGSLASLVSLQSSTLVELDGLDGSRHRGARLHHVLGHVEAVKLDEA